MQSGTAILLTLTVSTIFGVEPSKNLEARLPNTNSSEITLDVEQVQQIRQIKKGVNEIFEKARKARGKSKQDKTQFNSSLNKATLPISTIKENSKKTCKGSFYSVNKKVKKPLKKQKKAEQKNSAFFYIVKK